MEPLQTRFIIEILGRPALHVKETLQNVVEKLGQEKGVKLTHTKTHDSRPVEGAPNMFTSFAEVEATFDSIQTYLGIIFAYMPSNVEVIAPSSITLSNEEMSILGNQLISRLHLYESVAKRLVSEREILINRLKDAGVSLAGTETSVKLASSAVKKSKPKRAAAKKKKKR